MMDIFLPIGQTRWSSLTELNSEDQPRSTRLALQKRGSH